MIRQVSLGHKFYVISGVFPIVYVIAYFGYKLILYNYIQV
jgi:hypothetical protein